MLREVAPDEFDDRLSPIFEHISKEAGTPFNGRVLFPMWREMMKAKMARTWEDDGCVLGALFVPDLFNGRKRGLVYFWFSLPSARGTGRPIRLLEAFEKAAVEEKCEIISISSHAALKTRKTARIYAHRGYKVSETVFSKNL